MFARINNAILTRMAAKQSHEDGQAMAEYGLILALIAVVAITATTSIGTAVAAKFTAVATAL